MIIIAACLILGFTFAVLLHLSIKRDKKQPFKAIDGSIVDEPVTHFTEQNVIDKAIEDGKLHAKLDKNGDVIGYYHKTRGL